VPHELKIPLYCHEITFQLRFSIGKADIYCHDFIPFSEHKHKQLRPVPTIPSAVEKIAPTMARDGKSGCGAKKESQSTTSNSNGLTSNLFINQSLPDTN
jgi:hypothetical protein